MKRRFFILLSFILLSLFAKAQRVEVKDWWNDLSVFQVNKVAPRTSVVPNPVERYSTCLNADWRFSFTKSPDDKMEAHAKERSIKKYACTFLGVLVKKIGQQYLVVSAYIGDGAIGMLSKGEFISLSTPDGGEQVGETRFATMPEIWGKTQEEQEKIMESRTLCSWIEDFDCLMSMTDGVSDPKFGTDNNLKKLELWEKLWQELKEDVINAKSESSRDDLLVKWLDFYEEGHHDDRTIALIY